MLGARNDHACTAMAWRARGFRAERQAAALPAAPAKVILSRGLQKQRIPQAIPQRLQKWCRMPSIAPTRVLRATPAAGVPAQYSVSRPTAPPRARTTSASRYRLVRRDKA